MKTRRIILFGIPFDTVNQEQAVLKLHYYSQLPKGTQKICVTPNPEMIVEAARNENFQKTLAHSDFSLADGTGILWASGFLPLSKMDLQSSFRKKITIENLVFGIGSFLRFLLLRKWFQRQIHSRVTGTDVFGHFLATSQSKIFLLGGKKGAAERLAEEFSSVVGFYDGFVEADFDQDIIRQINDSGAEVLFVALGSPRQELWISENITKLSNIRFAMGVGGAFDFITGLQKRAPEWMRRSGFEWFYRLIKQPLRIGRIYNATIKFFLLTVREKYTLTENVGNYAFLRKLISIVIIIGVVLAIILATRVIFILGSTSAVIPQMGVSY